MWVHNLLAIGGYLSLLEQFQISHKFFALIIFLYVIAIFIIALLRYKNRSLKSVKEDTTELRNENVPVERYALYVDSQSLFEDIERLKRMINQQVKPPYNSFKGGTENLNNFFQGKKFDIISFLKDAAGGRNCVLNKYYRGYPLIFQGQENRPLIEAKEAKLKFIDYMKDNGYEVPEGGLEIRVNGHFQEEGVDTLLILDVFEDAINDLYDTAIIISSRRKILPLVKRINNLGKRYIYVGLYDNKINDLYDVAYKRRMYKFDQIKNFFKETIPENGVVKN